VDTKLRQANPPPGGFPKVLGWDGAGIVEACGSAATGFRVGDRVYFAGSWSRNGSNADLVAIDERIVARAPASRSAAVAASVPLVTLTAWEGLEQLGVDPATYGSGRNRYLLVIPGAGGVGSYVIQLAKACGLQVIATASREESRNACLALGADFVINHREPLKPQLETLGIAGVHFIYDAVDFKGYAEQFGEIIKPFGKIVSITMIGQSQDYTDVFKFKSVAVMHEFMFARAQFEDDMDHQGKILAMAAQLIDDGKLQTPVWKSLTWSLESLQEAHRLQESGKAIGKIVLAKAAAEAPAVAPLTAGTMTVFGLKAGGHDNSVQALEEFELPVPELQAKDLLVRVDAVAMNPVDTKIRKAHPPPGGFPKVLGWDGAGVVKALGPQARGFKVGDRVYFAGSLIRNGSNSDYVAVDERIVAHAPASRTAAVAASVPLVALTAWEGLEQLGVDPDTAGSGAQRRLLVIPGAGGVGSYIIQLAKACGLQVIATASREESRNACFELGADFVINHREPLKPQLEKLGIRDVHLIYDAVDFTGYSEQYGEIIQPFGKLVSITTHSKVQEMPEVFKRKSVSVSTEFMYTRSMFTADDIGRQRHILTRAAKMIDDGKLQTPIWKELPWSLESLRQAHELQESGKAIGKIIMSREAAIHQPVRVNASQATASPATVSLTETDNMLQPEVPVMEVPVTEVSNFPKPWPQPKEGKKKVLIVISHPNTGKSFNHRLVDAAKATLEADGHAVIVDDLIKIGFNPTTGKHDFTSLKNPESFDLQTEQKHVVDTGAKFADELQEQLDLVDWCDLVIHQFPIYWWSVPAVHKGWIDRCLVYHYAYPPHVSKWTGKQWMMSVTVGPDTEKAIHPAPGSPMKGMPYQQLLSHAALATPAMCAMEPVPMWICGHAAKGASEKAEMVSEYVEHIKRFVCGAADMPEPKWSASVDMQKTIRDVEHPSLPEDHLGIVYGK
jgi:zinc-binding alcohol dehydrogenase family protein